MLFVPGMNPLDDQLIHRMEVAASDFFLYQLLSFRFELHRHTSKLTDSGAQSKRPTVGDQQNWHRVPQIMNRHRNDRAELAGYRNRHWRLRAWRVVSRNLGLDLTHARL